MRTYSFPERTPKVPGPWEGEPDKAQWVDETTDLDCLIVRNRFGALCGYAGVPPSHPWHGRQHDELPVGIDVHGGLTYSSLCQEGAENGPGVCHVPEPGRPAEVWWFGFDCGHWCDDYPMRQEWEGPMRDSSLFNPPAYRTFEWVQAECTSLAKQLAEVGGA